ncbi:hypothetical protein D3C87_2139130 [compost metagenome]
MDVDEDERGRVMEDVRRRDSERFALETADGIYAGRDLIHGNTPRGDVPAGPGAA